MKKLSFKTIMLVLAVLLFGGITTANAATLPTTFTTGTYSSSSDIVSYITAPNSKGEYRPYRVIVKHLTDGNYAYCLDLDLHYDGGINYTKSTNVDPGYTYILNHIPNTGDSKKDFYITQMAIWYYEDYLNNNNEMLPLDVKQFIVSVYEYPDKATKIDASTKAVVKQIYELYYAAKNYHNNYTSQEGKVTIDTTNVTFTLVDGYYVSSEIKVTTQNITGSLKYSLSNAPTGSKIVAGSTANTVVVKVPASAIAAGQELTFTMNVAGNYTSEKAYYYYADSSHQRLLYGKTETTNETVNASITLRIRHYNDSYKVKISKTDVTQTKEVAGATLVLKDSTGKVVDTWVSTNTSHEITLATGEYSLTETIAPNGYKLSITTINFLVNQDGTLYEKVNGKYQLVSKINMINELLDTVTIAKKDSKTGNYVSGAVLVIKDASGNVVSEFTTTDTVYQLSLNAGVYTLTEKTAPNGYVLSSEVITFKITNDGTLQIKNSNGDYEDTAIITFLNTPKKTETVKVPSTGKNATIMIMAGIALLIAGVVYVKKTTKEC